MLYCGTKATNSGWGCFDVVVELGGKLKQCGWTGMWVGLMAPGGLRFQDLSNVNINPFAANLRHKFDYNKNAQLFL